MCVLCVSVVNVLSIRCCIKCLYIIRAFNPLYRKIERKKLEKRKDRKRKRQEKKRQEKEKTGKKKPELGTTTEQGTDKMQLLINAINNNDHDDEVMMR